MKKRIASLLLAAALCCGLFALPAQAVAATQSEMLQVLAVLGVMNGDKQGNLNLTSPVTRAEFAKMAVTASSFKDLGTETTGVSPFSDVPHSHWAAGYITTARNAGWLSGYLDGTFRPSGQVTLAEALTVVLKMLGYTDADFTGTWPSGQMTLYRSLQLDANISASAATPLTRLECAWLLYNALGATTKAGAQYGPSMGCPLDAGGKPDYLALINSKLQGPYVVTDGSWSSAIGFTPKTVYRNDAASSSSQIERYDVLYYYKTTSTVYAYSTRHTGTIDSILPNRAAPTSVVLSGVSYTLGTAAASYSVSSLGEYQVGDTVTLLMGRDGTVAAVVKASDINETLYGVVTATGTDIYTNASGGSYSSKYVQVLAIDGVSYRYTTSRDFREGEVVCVSSANGTVSIQACSKNSSYSGTVNAAGTQLGSYSLSPDLQILDVYKSSGKSIAVQRLCGATLNASNILYAGVNARGQIEQLLLDNFTGDIHTYGLVLSSTVISNDAASASSYDVLIDGSETTLGSTTKAFTEFTGPAQFSFDAAELNQVQKLTAVKAAALTQTTLSAENGAYTLSGTVQVYIEKDHSYRYSSVQEVLDLSRYTVTGYYDNSNASGGRIRVIIAKEK